MYSDTQLIGIIKHARAESTKRRFTQSVELIVVLKDIDVKRGFNLLEVVELPHRIQKNAKICVIASGDMSTRARKAGVDKVIEQDELNRLGTNKREARKIVRSYDFFLADTSLMASVGRSLGQFLGPKGKMPSPVPYGAPIENIAERFRGSVRMRSKNQLNLATKIGDEKMDDENLASNASAIIATIEKKLPQGDKNIRSIMIKFTMGKPVNDKSGKSEAKK